MDNNLVITFKDLNNGELTNFTLPGADYIMSANPHETGVENICIDHILRIDANLNEELGLLLKIYEFYLQKVKEKNLNLSMIIKLNGILPLYAETFIRSITFSIRIPPDQNPDILRIESLSIDGKRGL